MIANRPTDVAHKIQLLRLLTAIVDDPVLSSSLYFKGGTCAAMSGFLNRFSVDLDFDFVGTTKEGLIRTHLKKIFQTLGLTIETEGRQWIMYSVKYSAPSNVRNTIHIDGLRQVTKATTYEARMLGEIKRVVTCQTKESMVSHKLVAILDRWEKHHAVAGRDIYDIHEFFLKQYPYIPEILTERTGLSVSDFFETVIGLIEREVTDQLLQEDLNTVLMYDEFRKIRTTLKQETLLLLRTERERIKKEAVTE